MVKTQNSEFLKFVAIDASTQKGVSAFDVCIKEVVPQVST